MKKNKFINFHLFLLVGMLAFSCRTKTNIDKEILKKSSYDKVGLKFQINDSTITINGRQVFFEDSLDIWEKSFGKYNKKSDEGGIGMSYLWDSLGIEVATNGQGYKNGFSEVLVRELHIYFLGLDSPEAKTGKFAGAEDYNFVRFKDSLAVINFELELAQSEIKEERITKDKVINRANKWWDKIVNDNRNPQNYLYPYRGFKGKLYINGIEITANKHLKDLNKERWDSGNNLFRYIDRRSSWYGSNKTGETEKIYDTYYYLAQPMKMSKNHPIWYELKYFEEKLLSVSIKLVPPERAEQYIELHKE